MKQKQQKNIIIENVTKHDFGQIHAIYSHYVTHSTISLEETSPSVEEMMRRYLTSKKNSLPYLVARIDGNIAGYAYAVPYRSRAAYRFTVEESVYVSKDYHGLGVGSILLSALIDDCRNKGFKQILAVISGSNNCASIKFHESMGFRKSGILEKFGFKFNKWIDTVLMQKHL